MKLIKEGKEIKMRVTCEKCEAELEIQAGDLTKSFTMTFEPTTYYYICPCCKHINHLRYYELSEKILFDLRD